VTEQLIQQLDPTAPQQRLELRLSPPALGRVTVEIVRDGEQLAVTFRADSPQTEQALREGADDLVTALLGRGGGWREVTVRIADDAPGDDREAPSDEGRRRQQRERRQPSGDGAA
jgi:flagellar hook-length control protein FliK